MQVSKKKEKTSKKKKHRVSISEVEDLERMLGLHKEEQIHVSNEEENVLEQKEYTPPAEKEELIIPEDVQVDEKAVQVPLEVKEEDPLYSIDLNELSRNMLESVQSMSYPTFEVESPSPLVTLSPLESSEQVVMVREEMKSFLDESKEYPRFIATSSKSSLVSLPVTPVMEQSELSLSAVSLSSEVQQKCSEVRKWFEEQDNAYPGPFFHLIERFKDAQRYLETIDSSIQTFEKQIETSIHSIWTFQDKSTLLYSTCGDGDNVSYTLEYEIGDVDASALVGIDGILRDLRVKRVHETTNAKFMSVSSKIQIESFLTKFMESPRDLRFIHMLRSYLNVLFFFERASRYEKLTEFKNNLRRWIRMLAYQLKSCGDRLDHQFLLLHSMKTTGVTKWGDFVSFDVKEWTREEQMHFLALLRSLWTPMEVRHDFIEKASQNQVKVSSTQDSSCLFLNETELRDLFFKLPFQSYLDRLVMDPDVSCVFAQIKVLLETMELAIPWTEDRLYLDLQTFLGKIVTFIAWKIVTVFSDESVQQQRDWILVTSSSLLIRHKGLWQLLGKLPLHFLSLNASFFVFRSFFLNTLVMELSMLEINGSQVSLSEWEHEIEKDLSARDEFVQRVKQNPHALMSFFNCILWHEKAHDLAQIIIYEIVQIAFLSQIAEDTAFSAFSNFIVQTCRRFPQSISVLLKVFERNLSALDRKPLPLLLQMDLSAWTPTELDFTLLLRLFIGPTETRTLAQHILLELNRSESNLTWENAWRNLQILEVLVRARGGMLERSFVFSQREDKWWVDCILRTNVRDHLCKFLVQPSEDLLYFLLTIHSAFPQDPVLLYIYQSLGSFDNFDAWKTLVRSDHELGLQVLHDGIPSLCRDLVAPNIDFPILRVLLAENVSVQSVKEIIASHICRCKLHGMSIGIVWFWFSEIVASSSMVWVQDPRSLDLMDQLVELCIDFSEAIEILRKFALDQLSLKRVSSVFSKCYWIQFEGLYWESLRREKQWIQKGHLLLEELSLMGSEEQQKIWQSFDDSMIVHWAKAISAIPDGHPSLVLFLQMFASFFCSSIGSNFFGFKVILHSHSDLLETVISKCSLSGPSMSIRDILSNTRLQYSLDWVRSRRFDRRITHLITTDIPNRAQLWFDLIQNPSKEILTRKFFPSMMKDEPLPFHVDVQPEFEPIEFPKPFQLNFDDSLDIDGSIESIATNPQRILEVVRKAAQTFEERMSTHEQLNTKFVDVLQRLYRNDEHTVRFEEPCKRRDKCKSYASFVHRLAEARLDPVAQSELQEIMMLSSSCRETSEITMELCYVLVKLSSMSPSNYSEGEELLLALLVNESKALWNFPVSSFLYQELFEKLVRFVDVSEKGLLLLFNSLRDHPKLLPIVSKHIQPPPSVPVFLKALELKHIPLLNKFNLDLLKFSESLRKELVSLLVKDLLPRSSGDLSEFLKTLLQHLIRHSDLKADDLDLVAKGIVPLASMKLDEMPFKSLFALLKRSISMKESEKKLEIVSGILASALSHTEDDQKRFGVSSKSPRLKALFKVIHPLLISSPIAFKTFVPLIAESDTNIIDKLISLIGEFHFNPPESFSLGKVAFIPSHDTITALFIAFEQNVYNPQKLLLVSQWSLYFLTCSKWTASHLKPVLFNQTFIVFSLTLLTVPQTQFDSLLILWDALSSELSSNDISDLMKALFPKIALFIEPVDDHDPFMEIPKPKSMLTKAEWIYNKLKDVICDINPLSERLKSFLIFIRKALLVFKKDGGALYMHIGSYLQLVLEVLQNINAVQENPDLSRNGSLVVQIFQTVLSLNSYESSDQFFRRYIKEFNVLMVKQPILSFYAFNAVSKTILDIGQMVLMLEDAAESFSQSSDDISQLSKSLEIPEIFKDEFEHKICDYLCHRVLLLLLMNIIEEKSGHHEVLRICEHSFEKVRNGPTQQKVENAVVQFWILSVTWPLKAIEFSWRRDASILQNSFRDRVLSFLENVKNTASGFGASDRFSRFMQKLSLMSPKFRLFALVLSVVLELHQLENQPNALHSRLELFDASKHPFEGMEEEILRIRAVLANSPIEGMGFSGMMSLLTDVAVALGFK